MKTFTKIVMVAGLTFGAMATAQANSQFVAADDAITSEICVIAAKGNKMKLHKAIKEAGLTRGFVEDNVTCNELPIVDFVEQYGDNDYGFFLNVDNIYFLNYLFLILALS